MEALKMFFVLVCVGIVTYIFRRKIEEVIMDYCPYLLAVLAGIGTIYTLLVRTFGYLLSLAERMNKI